MRPDDLDEEVRSHLEMETERNIERGLSPEEARQAALRSFGSVTRTQERVWEMRPGALLDGARQDLRYALRTLRRAPGFTAVAVLTLALGIGASTTMFSVIRAVLLRPLPYPEAHRLYEMTGVDASGRATAVSVADFLSLRERAASWEQMAVSARLPNYLVTYLMTGVPEPATVFAPPVDARFLTTIGVPPELGRNFTAEEGAPGAPRVALISHRLWQQNFAGDPHVLGRSLLLNGEGHTVIGVMPPGFHYPHRLFDMWLPWQPGPEDLRDRRQRNASVLVRLKRGATPEQARAELETLARDLARQYPDTNTNWRPVLTQVGAQQVAPVRDGVLLLGGAVACLLLMACLNVANLLLARAAERRSEIAIRAALGAGRGRLLRQMLVESLLLAVLGAGGGILLTFWAGRAVAGAFAELVPRIEDTRLDAHVLVFAVLAAALTAVLFGAWPALRATSSRLAVARFRVSPSGVLVTAQVAICLVLLAGAGLLLRSLVRLLGVDPGFRPQRIVTLSIPSPRIRGPREAQQVERYRRIVEHVRTLPGVEASGLITVLPLGRLQATVKFGIAGRLMDPQRTDELPGAQLRTVSAGYFETMRIPVLRGRDFLDSDGREAPPVVIINEELARRYWPGEDPVGKQIQTQIGPTGPRLTVVGVVGNVKYASLRDRPEPELYHPYLQYLGFPQMAMLAVRTASDPLALAATLRREIRRLEPDQPIGDVKTMEQFVSDAVGRPRFYAVLLAVFAALALLVAATGLLGVMSYAVSRRTQEIGVRMAVGARPADIVGMVVAEGGRYWGAGVALGLGGALAATRLLRSLLFEVTPADPATFAAAVALLAGVALAATAAPARRAARVDPMTALRHE